MNAHRMSACSLSVVLAAVAGQAPCAAGVLVEKSLVESGGGTLNSLNAFGLSHTATGNSQLALSPTGALMVTNIGSSGLDGVSFPLGHGRGHSMIMSMGEMGLLAPGGEVAVYYPYSFGERCVYVRGDAGGGAVLGIDEQVHDPERYGRVAVKVTMLNGGVAFGANEAYMMPMNEFIVRNGVDVVTGDIGSDPLSGEGVSLRTEMTEWGYVHTMKLPVESVLQLLDEHGVDSGVGGLADEVRIEVVGLPPGRLLGGAPGVPPEPVRVVARDLGQDLAIREHVLLASGVRSQDDGAVRDFNWTQTSGPFRARGGALFSGIDLGGIVTPFTDVTDPRWRNPNNPQAGIVVSNIGSSGLDGVEVDFAIHNVCPDWLPVKCPNGRCARNLGECPALPVQTQVLRLNDAGNPLTGGVLMPDDGDELSVEALTTDDAGVTTWTGGRVTLRNIPAAGGFDYELMAQMTSTGATQLTVAVLDDGALQGVHTEFVNEANVMARLGNHPNVCQFIGLVPPEGDLVSVVPQTAGAYVFQLSGNADVEVGGTLYSGDALYVFVNDPPVAFPGRVSMRETSAGLAPHIVEMRSDEQPDDVVTVLGTRGQPKGGAIFLSQNDSLVVSNIGSSGLDGVSLDFEEATGFELPIEQGGEFTPQSSTRTEYWQVGDRCPSVAPIEVFGLTARATAPDQITVSMNERDPTALVDVTLFDAAGNEVGAFTMDQTQTFQVRGADGNPIKSGFIRMDTKKAPGGGTGGFYVCYSVNMTAQPPGGGAPGGVEVTFGQGLPTTDVTDIEFCPSTKRPPYRGHVTVLKAHDPGGGSGTPGDLVLGAMSKKGYDHYLAKSDAGLRSGVVTTGDGDSVYLINGIGEQEEGFGHDLSRGGLNNAPGVSHSKVEVEFFPVGNPIKTGKVRMETTRSPGSGGGALFIEGTMAGSPAGYDFGLNIEDGQGAPVRYAVSISMLDGAGNLLAFEDGAEAPLVDGASPVLVSTFSAGPPNSWAWVNADSARIRRRPDLLTQEWDSITHLVMPRSGQNVTGVRRVEYLVSPESEQDFEVETWDGLRVDLAKNAGTIVGLNLWSSTVQSDAPPCPADVNGDGVIDNGDIGIFITLFLAQDPSVDFTGDGVIDNGDIGAFIAAFLAGC